MRSNMLQKTNQPPKDKVSISSVNFASESTARVHATHFSRVEAKLYSL